MAIVKRTFSIPEEISEALDSTIPNQEKSKFISMTLAEALRKRNREKLIETLDNVEPFELQEESAVEIIRKIREKHSARLPQ